MNHGRLLGSLTTALVLAACGGDEEVTDPPLPVYVIDHAIDEVILPEVGSFAEATTELAEAATSFCADPSSTRLEAARAEWRTTSEAWKAIVAFNFGPLDDDLITPSILFVESMRQRGIDYTDTVREAIDEVLASTEPVGPETFEGLRFNEVGLLALEVLLFESTGPDHPQGVPEVLADYLARPRKCPYLEGMAGLLVDRATRIRSGWTEAFGDSEIAFSEQMRSGRLPGGAEPVPLLLSKVFEHLEYLLRRKLEGILDARLADHFYPNVRSTLTSLRVLLSSGPRSISSVMAARGASEAAARVEADLSSAVDAADAQDRGALTLAVQALEDHFVRTIPDALGVELGLNFSDGD